jgi:hypothetical protein
MEERRRLPTSPLTPDYGSGGEYCEGRSGDGLQAAAPTAVSGGGCYTNGLLLADCGSSEHSSDCDNDPPPPPARGVGGNEEDNNLMDDNDDEDDDIMNDDDEMRLVVDHTAAAAMKRFSGSSFGGGGGESGPPSGGLPEGGAAGPTLLPPPAVHKRETIVSVGGGGSAGCSTRTATARVNFAPGREGAVLPTLGENSRPEISPNSPAEKTNSWEKLRIEYYSSFLPQI